MRAIVLAEMSRDEVAFGGASAAIAASRRARSFSPFSKISPPSDRP